MNAILTTDRLSLREMHESDLDFVAEMLGDTEVMRFYPGRLDRAGSRRWLQRQVERYARDGHGLWLVDEGDSGDPVGQVGLIRQEVEGDLLAEIGYLIHRPYWRQGFATEAARGVRRYAFDRLNLEMVHSLIRPVNLPSIGVAEKLGMRPLRHVTFHEIEHILYRVTRDAGS